MNPIEKLLNMFRRNKSEPKFAKCLQHRTWLDRQVKEEMINRAAQTRVSSTKAQPTIAKDDNWYTKYI